MLKVKEPNGKQWGKLLWYDPNPTDNEPINLSELTISVDLKVTSKNISVISSNSINSETTLTNTGEESVVNVNFFNGSKDDYKGGDFRTLTTNYTNLQDLTSDINNDYEALGIESINITFNSSYAPMIKIKFIDIRGAAMFSNGGKGKYKFFFELPYPLFNLTIKGYYGKSVKYCLHLLRFNASFNSQTGNFEIDCDFIGFTYALLTDMLMGLVRASVTTNRGQKIFNSIKSEYKNQDSIITIDELVVRISEIDEAISKIKKGEEVVELAKIKQAKEEIENLKNIVKFHLDTYAATGTKFTNNYSNGVLIITEPNDTQKDSLKNSKLEYKEDIIEKVKKDIKEKNLIDFTNTAKYGTIINEIDSKNDDSYFNFTSFGYVLKHGFNTSDKNNEEKIKDLYPDGSEQRINYMIQLLKDINFGNTEKITIIDLSRAIKACDNSLLALDDQEAKAVTEATDTLKTEIKSVLGFDPTIRNLFRILCTSTEVFLQCMLDVSRDAEKDTGGKRLAALNKLGRTNLNTNKKDNIYPWPEYRKQGIQSDGYYEEWMGNEISTTDVPELLFTEELLDEMILQARKDKLRESELNGGNGWYPISVIDTPVDNGLTARMLENPYKIGLIEEISSQQPKGTSDEALRVMFYRAFLLLGIANRNDINDDLIKLHAKLEAENLYDVLRKMPNIETAKRIKDEIVTSNSNNIINRFNNNTNLVFSGPKRPFFKDSGDNYVYNYIVDDSDGRAYIPINGYFNTFIFEEAFENGKPTKLKNAESIFEIRNNGGLFVSNVSNHTRYIDNGEIKVDNSSGNYDVSRHNLIKNDGAIHLKIISEGAYLNQNNYNTPSFGSSVLSGYKGDGAINHSIISQAIRYPKISNFYFNPLRSGDYLANEYNKIYYDSGAKSSEYTNDNIPLSTNGGISSLVAFFNEGANESNFSKPLPSQIKFSNYELTFNGFASKFDKTKIKYGWYNKKEEDYFRAKNEITKQPTYHYENYGKNRQVLNGKLNPELDNDLYVPKIEYRVDEIFSYSLFGSEFYYYQNNVNPVRTNSNVSIGQASRALLFLHCFPFQGVNKRGDDTWDRFMFDFISQDNEVSESIKNVDIISNPATEILGIKSLFRCHNAFIGAPKIWTLFIGAMLWRMNYSYNNNNTDPIRWKKPQLNNDSLIPNLISPPRIDCFLSVSLGSNYLPSGMNFYSKDNDYPLPYGKIFEDGTGTYSRIDETIIGLPNQIKDEFINNFLNWVSFDFTKIQQLLEIPFKYDLANVETDSFLSKAGSSSSSFDSDSYFGKWTRLNDTYINFPNETSKEALKVNDVKTILGENIINNYVMVCPISSGQTSSFKYPSDTPVKPSDVKIYVVGKNSYNMELKADGDAMDLIVKLLTEKVYIQNLNPNAWNPPNLNDNLGKNVSSFTPIKVSKNKLGIFVETFHSHLKTISVNLEKETSKEEDRIQQELFKSMDDDKIKLNIYRTLMSIYQKWIGGLKGNMFQQCTVNSKDIDIARYERKSNTNNPRLIESFRFLDRSFNDIGDSFYMNPQVFYNMIVNNRNVSFFDVANKVLSDNNFNFIPLPTFVNFNNPKELADIFEPYPYNDEPITGPSFVCVYAGQSSTNLELGEKSLYPDDGIFIIIDKNGNYIPESMPKDLIGKTNINEVDSNNQILKPYETNLPIFTVNYGQQNQNYFKDVKLDQSEFSETAESLEIIDKISENGDKRKPIMVGQNLFNTYQTRSYSCEVEMLGCALIQPMMYFQLNNIPMFRGLYLIINVSHSIKPNGMTTTFKGVRVKKTKTPLLTASDVLMNLIGDISNVDTTRVSTSSSSSGSVTNASGCPIFTLNNTNRVSNEIIKKSLEDNNIGLTDNAIKGIMGNLYIESTFIPGNFNTTGGGCGAYGLAQWRNYDSTTKGRQTNLANFINDLGVSSNDVNSQIKFLMHELKTIYKGTYNALKTESISVEAAARIFYLTYEFGSTGTQTLTISNYDTEDKANGLIDRIFTKASKTSMKQRVDKALTF